MQPVPVSADGLVLRPWRLGDRDVIASVSDDPELAAWNPMAVSPEEWIAARIDWSDGTHASWAVVLPGDEDDAVGSVSLHHIDERNSASEIGYWVRSDHRGRGIGTAALRTAAGFGFAELGLRRIVLFHAVGNVGSCRVAEKAGFLLEGVHRQSFRYGDGGFHDEHSHARLASDPS